MPVRWLRKKEKRKTKRREGVPPHGRKKKGGVNYPSTTGPDLTQREMQKEEANVRTEERQLGGVGVVTRRRLNRQPSSAALKTIVVKLGAKRRES